MTVSTLIVSTAAAENGYAPLKVVASNNPNAQTVELYNPTSVAVIATVSCPLAFGETSRTWTASNVVGTVAGLDTSGTDGFTDSVTLDAGERCKWVLTSTYDLTPQDVTNETIDLYTSTILFTVTETTVNAVAVTDPDPYSYPLQSVYMGTGRPFFGVRTRNVSHMLHAAFGRTDDAATQRLIDFFEQGGSFADLARPTSQTLSFYFPGHTTAGTAKESGGVRIPFAGTITNVDWVADTAVTGQATNFFTLNVRNRTTAGVGTGIPAALAFSAGGVTAVAQAPTPITLATLQETLNVAPGDIITAEKAVSGTGLAMPAGSIVIRIKAR